MRPNFDGQLHDLLDDAAREIPPDATVIPALLRRIANEEHHTRSFSMRSFQRFIAPAIAAVLVMALAVTFVTIRGARGHTSVATKPSVTATATLAPSVGFTPATITQGGITIQLDKVDANAFRVAVGYHFTTPLPHPGDEFNAGSLILVDDANIVHHSVGSEITHPQGLTGTPYLTEFFAPLNAGPATAHTLHFVVPQVMTLGVEGSSFKQFTKGPWDFTLHVVSVISGATTVQNLAQTAGGIVIAPQSIGWFNGTDSFTGGAVVRLTLSGLPKVADPVQHPRFFFMEEEFRSASGSQGQGLGPGQKNDEITLALASGENSSTAYFASADTPYDAQNLTGILGGTGSISQNGTALVDVGFQGVTLQSGETLKLTIKKLVVSDSNNYQDLAGPWSFTFTI